MMNTTNKRLLILSLVLAAGSLLLPPAVSADELSRPATGSLTAGQGPGPVRGPGQDILPAGEAFRFGFYEEAGGYRVFWQVMPGYFLYRDKFRFVTPDGDLSVSLPEGQPFNDEVFGEVEVFDGLLEVSLPDASPGTEIWYQGCAEVGYCYPPQKKQLTSSK